MTSCDNRRESLKQSRYRLRFEARAWDEWKKLDGAPKQELRDLLISRLDNPKVPGSALKGVLAGCYKIKMRKSGYRLVYEVIDDIVVVLVLAVDKCEDAAAYESAAKRLMSSSHDEAVRTARNKHRPG